MVVNFIKTILKQTLPTAFLKKAFLVVNRIKIKTIDRAIYPEFKVDNKDFQVYRSGYPFQESGIDINSLYEKDVKHHMLFWQNWTQEEFLLVLNTPCWIEPEFGWAIVEPLRLVYYSLGVSRTIFQSKPSVLRFIKRKKNYIRVPKAISLRDTGEENYFHFYNDVLTKLFFLQENNIELTSSPIIISKRLWDKQYFQFYYSHSKFLKSLTWVIQDDGQYVQCDTAIFCKPLTHRKDLWSAVISPAKGLATVNRANRKIFLTRSKTRLRFIENVGEIEEVCKRHAIDIVDADNLAFGKQVELFTQTTLIIGIHGAGLTNMIYSGRSCIIMEIFPPPDRGYLPYHYLMLADMCNLRYHAMIGEAGKIAFSGGFYLPAAQFEKRIKEYL